MDSEAADWLTQSPPRGLGWKTGSAEDEALSGPQLPSAYSQLSVAGQYLLCPSGH